MVGRGKGDSEVWRWSYEAPLTSIHYTHNLDLTLWLNLNTFFLKASLEELWAQLSPITPGGGQYWQWHKSRGEREQQKRSVDPEQGPGAPATFWARQRETKGFKNRTASLLQAGKTTQTKADLPDSKQLIPTEEKKSPKPQRGDRGQLGKRKGAVIGLKAWSFVLKWPICSLPLKREQVHGAHEALNTDGSVSGDGKAIGNRAGCFWKRPEHLHASTGYCL